MRRLVPGGGGWGSVWMRKGEGERVYVGWEIIDGIIRRGKTEDDHEWNK